MSTTSSESAEIPPVFACTLPPPELRQRRVDVLAKVRRRAKRVEEVANGFVLWFEPAPDLDQELADFVRFESVCCSFITMALTKHGTEVELRMTTPEGGKALVRTEFIDVLETTADAGATACRCSGRSSGS